VIQGLVKSQQKVFRSKVSRIKQVVYNYLICQRTTFAGKSLNSVKTGDGIIVSGYRACTRF